MAAGGVAPFEARYSIPKLLVWVLLASTLAAASGWMTLTSLSLGSVTATILGGTGLLMFGGASIGYLQYMIDRRVQLRVASDGLFLRPHSDLLIKLRSIQRAQTDLGMVKLLLHKPSKYPIKGRLRRFIYRINGAHARAFFGDAWIWTRHYDCSPQQVLEAINAHIAPTPFEQDMAARLAQAAMHEQMPSKPEEL